MMHQKDLNNWEEFEEEWHKLLNEYPNASEFLFRGHSDAEFLLTTTLERFGRKDISLSDYYRSISRVQPQIESFTERNWEIPTWPDFDKEINQLCDPAFNNKLPQDVYDYMIYLRHHGFPSPILDWSQSPYIAAFFAFRCPDKPVSDRVSIHIFSSMPRGIGDVMGGYEPRIIHLGPYVRTHKRHFLQQCNYTMCLRYDEETKKEYCFSHEQVFMSQNTHNSYRCKFTLPWVERGKVLNRLEKHNLNAYSLFGSEETLMETMALRELVFKD